MKIIKKFLMKALWIFLFIGMCIMCLMKEFIWAFTTGIILGILYESPKEEGS